MNDAAHEAEPARPALEAVRARRSWSKVTDAAPTHAELVTLVSAAGRVADHSSLRPWRIIELRGDDRRALGAAIAKAEGDAKPSTKPLRAPLVLAVVASYQHSKVPHWEQEAVASGVAHVLSLLLDEAGWGVFWRTGSYTRTKPVAKAHGLGKDEELLGWLYVGGKPERSRPSRRKAVDAQSHVSRMPGATALPDELVHWRKDSVKAAAKKKKAKKGKKGKKPTDWVTKAEKAERKAQKAAQRAEKARARAAETVE